MTITIKTAEKWKREAQNRNKTLKRSAGNNLSLESFANGKQFWRWRYNFSGKPKTLSLGSFPEVTLHKANELALEARRKVKQNIDPSAERQDLKRSRILNAQNTFEAVAEECLTYRGKNGLGGMGIEQTAIFMEHVVSWNKFCKQKNLYNMKFAVKSLN